MKCGFVWDPGQLSRPLSYYLKECGEAANQKGWKVTWTELPAYLMATIDELCDGFERGWRDNKEKKMHVEIGDCFIRLFHISHDLNIPLEKILIRLLEENKSRPYKHGHERI